MLPTTTFGGRIQRRVPEVGCPWCGAKRGERCTTAPRYTDESPKKLSWNQSHTGRWEGARAELVRGGDGPEKGAAR